jgi:hypothetical protein
MDKQVSHITTIHPSKTTPVSQRRVMSAKFAIPLKTGFGLLRSRELQDLWDRRIS